MGEQSARLCLGWVGFQLEKPVLPADPVELLSRQMALTSKLQFLPLPTPKGQRQCVWWLATLLEQEA
jgi:hypothetical protein